MPFPDSVDTVTLTCGPVLDADGNPRAGVKLYAVPPPHVFIAETKLRPGILSAATGADGTASLEVIATDSAGLADIRGNTITSFRYRIGVENISTASAEREVSLPKAVTTVAYEDLVTNNATTGTLAGLTSTFAPAYSAVQAQQYRTLESGDRMVQVQPPQFSAMSDPGYHPLIVRRDVRGQEMLGFGASMSDAAAWLLKNRLTAGQRTALLAHLYGPGSAGGCGWSTMRVSIGATETFRSPDTPDVYTLDDMPTNGVDVNLNGFDVTPDAIRTIPVIREVLAINPQTRIHATISNRPAWMQGSGHGGQYLRNNTPGSDTLMGRAVATAFANYCVRSIQAWEALGVPIYSFNPINEPFYSGRWAPTAIADFVNDYLGPAMRDAGLKTKLLLGEDNPDWAASTERLMQLAGGWADGTSWHGYNDSITGIGKVAAAFPGKSVHMTEMRNMLSETWGEAWGIMASRMMIGATRQGCASVTLWNLALDENGTATDGVNDYNTASGRQGVVTVPSNGSGTIVYNTGYWALNHLSRFVKTGARRIGVDTYNGGDWNDATDVTATAFENPDGSVVVMAHNPAATAKTFNVLDGASYQGFTVTMGAGEISTFTWGVPALNRPLGSVASAPSVPAAPVLTATAQNGQVSLSWTVPASDAPLSRYEVYRDGALISAVEAATTSYLDKIAAGTYAYTVKAVSPAGSSAASNSQSVTVAVALCTQIAKPTVTAIGNRVQLTWANVATDQVDSIGIYRSTTGGSVGSQIATLSPGTTEFWDTPTIASTVYYTVRPSNSAGPKSSVQSDGVSTSTTTARPDVVASGGVYLDYHSGFQQRRLSRLTSVVSISDTLRKPAAVVAVATSGVPATCSGVTYGGVAMTQLGAVAASTRKVALFGLANPPRGIREVVVDMGPEKGCNAEVAIMTLANVDQDTPFGTAVTSAATSTASGSVDTTGGAVSDLVVMAGCASQAISAVGGSQTRRDDAAHYLGSTYPVVTTQAGSAGTVTDSVTLGTSGNVALVSVAVKAHLT